MSVNQTRTLYIRYPRNKVKYDVLKFDVYTEDNFLNKVNETLRQNLPYENDYSDYRPHLTIGYFKKGTAKKYIPLFKNIKYEVEPSYVTYSKPNGEKYKIKINKNIT